MIDHVLSWAAVDEPRFELVEVTLHLGTLTARGTMLAGGVDPYRVDYHFDSGPAYITKRLVVTASARGWTRQIRIGRDADGTWSIRRMADPPDAAIVVSPETLRDVRDCDVRFAPLFNTMPVLRARLHMGPGGVDAPSALVTLPDLSLLRLEQDYRHAALVTGGAVVSQRCGPRAADITFGDDGFVTHYPGVARRVGPTPPPALAAEPRLGVGGSGFLGPPR